MLDYHAILDFETVSEIMKSGTGPHRSAVDVCRSPSELSAIIFIFVAFFFFPHPGFSRIPVYEGQRSNIVAMLFIKDLAFIDPDDNTPLKQLCDFYQNQCYFVFEDLTLDVLFKHFKDGKKIHPCISNLRQKKKQKIIEKVELIEIMNSTQNVRINRNWSNRRKSEK